MSLPIAPNEEARQHALAELRALKDSGDSEAAHIDADRIVMQLLSRMDMDDLVEAFEAIPKWYA